MEPRGAEERGHVPPCGGRNYHRVGPVAATGAWKGGARAAIVTAAAVAAVSNPALPPGVPLVRLLSLFVRTASAPIAPSFYAVAVTLLSPTLRGAAVAILLRIAPLSLREGGIIDEEPPLAFLLAQVSLFFLFPLCLSAHFSEEDPMAAPQQHTTANPIAHDGGLHIDAITPTPAIPPPS